MFDQLKMLAKAREIQKKMEKMVMQNDYQGIKITMNGKQEVINLEISPDLMTDQSTLEYRLKEAFNNSISKSQREMASAMQGDMAGLM